jgi:hypothetical protein
MPCSYPSDKYVRELRRSNPLLRGCCFSAKVDFILRYGDARPEDWNKPLTDEQKNMSIMRNENWSPTIMFSDIIEFEIRNGNSLFLVVTFDTKEEVQQSTMRFCRKHNSCPIKVQPTALA